MDKKMIPQKGEGRLFIVLPTLEDMLSFCKDSKMKAQVAGMEYSNFRKHCRMQTDLRIDTYTKCASAFDMDVLLLHLPKGMIESLRQFGIKKCPKKLVISLLFCNFIVDNQLITNIYSDDYH